MGEFERAMDYIKAWKKQRYIPYAKAPWLKKRRR